MLHELAQIEWMNWLKVAGIIAGWWIIVAIVANLFVTELPDEF